MTKIEVKKERDELKEILQDYIQVAEQANSFVRLKPENVLYNDIRNHLLNALAKVKGQKGDERKHCEVISKAGLCRSDTDGYCGYSQQTVDALTKERDELKSQLDIERMGHRDKIRRLEAELAAERIVKGQNDDKNCMDKMWQWPERVK